MNKTAIIHARVEPRTKKKAEGVLKKLGTYGEPMELEKHCALINLLLDCDTFCCHLLEFFLLRLHHSRDLRQRTEAILALRQEGKL